MKERIKVLQKRLLDGGIDAALLVYSRDVLYYTGTAQPSCLLVTPDDYTLYVRSGFEFAVQDVFIGREKLAEERRLEKVLAGALSRLAGKPGKIGAELDILTAEQYEALRKSCPGADFVNISPVTLEQRKVKEPGEIERLRRACDAVHAGHEAVLATLREGVTELELAAAVENAHRLAGHEGIFFIRLPDFFMSRGPIGAGPNLLRNSGVVYTITGVGMSPAVPAGPSRRAIGRGETVIVDIPTLVEGYHADQTRTYCIGKAGQAIHALYDDLQAIADHLIGAIRPGMRGSDVYQHGAAEGGRPGAVCGIHVLRQRQGLPDHRPRDRTRIKRAPDPFRVRFLPDSRGLRRRPRHAHDGRWGWGRQTRGHDPRRQRRQRDPDEEPQAAL